METSVRYSTLVDAKLRAVLVLKDGVIFNTKYEGSAKAGAVKVRKSGAATVADYDKENGIAGTVGASEYITVTIDHDKAINEIIDGYDAAAVPDGLVADRLDEAGYALALVLDTDGAQTLVESGTTMDDTTALDKDTVYGSIVDARTQMTKAGVPVSGRYVIVSPDTMALLLKSDEFIRASQLGDAVIQTGAVGQIAGFLVFESANLGDGVEFVAGHPDYATRVNEWAVEPALFDLNGSGSYVGASAVKGRKVYAHAVTASEAIIVKTAA